MAACHELRLIFEELELFIADARRLYQCNHLSSGYATWIGEVVSQRGLKLEAIEASCHKLA